MGIAHRDIKPSNVLIDVNGNPRLLDFGLAAIESADRRLTATNQLLGTPAYMSPEQWSGIAIDGRSDLYSLGCIFQMLTGNLPFAGTNTFDVGFKHLHQTTPDIDRIRPSALASICSRLMAKAPEDRFQTGRELIDALKNCDLEAQSSGDTKVNLSPSIILTLVLCLLCGIAACIFLHGPIISERNNNTGLRPKTTRTLTTEEVLINQIKKCLAENDIAGAHKLYAGRAGRYTEAMIDPLCQL